jgi:16S rRNA (guanine527-N7)-methyltransferase
LKDTKVTKDSTDVSQWQAFSQTEIPLTGMHLKPLQAEIQQGCAALHIELTDTAAEKLALFIGLLEKWNRVYNLTAVRDGRAMVVRHILDSLAVLPFLTEQSLLDVGTGAGLPGLPLAVARPELSVTLLDANAKKLRFVRQAVFELGLSNVEVVQSRMQEYQPAQSFDMVISRAVSNLGELYGQTARLVRPGGRILFMKGSLPTDEIQELEPDRETLHIERLKIPGLQAERHLLWMEKTLESSAET